MKKKLILKILLVNIFYINIYSAKISKKIDLKNPVKNFFLKKIENLNLKKILYLHLLFAAIGHIVILNVFVQEGFVE